MKLQTKIAILTILFGLRGISHLFDGIATVTKGMSYTDYSGAFINALTMGFIAYVLYSKREKWAYWIAVIFSGIVVARFVLATGLPLLSDASVLTTSIFAILVLNVLIFGIIPLILLSTKEVRNAFLARK